MMLMFSASIPNPRSIRFVRQTALILNDAFALCLIHGEANRKALLVHLLQRFYRRFLNSDLLENDWPLQLLHRISVHAPTQAVNSSANSVFFYFCIIRNCQFVSMSVGLKLNDTKC